MVPYKCLTPPDRQIKLPAPTCGPVPDPIRGLHGNGELSFDRRRFHRIGIDPFIDPLHQVDLFVIVVYDCAISA